MSGRTFLLSAVCAYKFFDKGVAGPTVHWRTLMTLFKPVTSPSTERKERREPCRVCFMRLRSLNDQELSVARMGHLVRGVCNECGHGKTK